MIRDTSDILQKDQLIDIIITDTGCAEALKYKEYEGALAVVERTDMAATCQVSIIHHQDSPLIGDTIDIAKEDARISFSSNKYEAVDKPRVHILFSRNISTVYFTYDERVIYKLKAKLSNYVSGVFQIRLRQTSIATLRTQFPGDKCYVYVDDEFPELVKQVEDEDNA